MRLLVKKIPVWFLALCCSLLVLLTNCQRQFDDIKNLKTAAGQQVIVLGDSITAGYGVAEEEAYPVLLSQQLGLPMLNRGISGDTTADGLARLQSDVLDDNPWLVIVGLGGNDFLQKLPKTETEQNLRAMTSAIQGEGAIVVLLGMNLGILKDTYKELYERVARDTGAFLIPQVLKGILDDPSRRQDDVIHPNPAGHAALARRIAEALQPLLETASWPPALRKFQ